MPDITGYAYTKEKKYSYIDPETGKIVYSETPLTGFAHTPQPREAEGYAPVSEEQAMRHKAALKQGLEAQGYKEHWMGEPGQEEFLGYVRPQADEMDAIIKQDYELGHLTILRQYTDDMKIARFYKNADPLMYESLARDAETRKVLGLAEIQANLDKSKRMFKQIDQDRRLSLEEGFKAKMGYYQKNPGFTMPQSERTKRPEMPAMEKPETRGTPLAVSSIQDMVTRAVTWVKKGESRFGFNPSREDVIKRLKESADVGGWKDRNQATKEAILAGLNVQLKDTEEVEDTWDEAMKSEIAGYIGVGQVSQSPYKEYPDAFQEEGIWKVIRNGKKFRIEE